VGQAGANSRNIISGNRSYGVVINNTTQTTVANNYIGIAADGFTPTGNKAGGVIVRGGATNTTIGGDTPDLGNVISGNTDNGDPAPLYGNGITLVDCSETTIAGNYIGTDASGTQPVANARDGIYLTVSATLNTVGLETAYNVVSGNTGIGIEVDGTNNYFDYNFVGLDAITLQPLPPLANGGGWWVINPNNGIGPDNYHN
jgi:titin